MSPLLGPKSPWPAFPGVFHVGIPLPTMSSINAVTIMQNQATKARDDATQLVAALSRLGEDPLGFVNRKFREGFDAVELPLTLDNFSSLFTAQSKFDLFVQHVLGQEAANIVVEMRGGRVLLVPKFSTYNPQAARIYTAEMHCKDVRAAINAEAPAPEQLTQRELALRALLEGILAEGSDTAALDQGAVRQLQTEQLLGELKDNLPQAADIQAKLNQGFTGGVLLDALPCGAWSEDASGHLPEGITVRKNESARRLVAFPSDAEDRYPKTATFDWTVDPSFMWWASLMITDQVCPIQRGTTQKDHVAETDALVQAAGSSYAQLFPETVPQVDSAEEEHANNMQAICDAAEALLQETLGAFGQEQALDALARALLQDKHCIRLACFPCVLDQGAVDAWNAATENQWAATLGYCMCIRSDCRPAGSCLMFCKCGETETCMCRPCFEMA